MSFWNAIRAYHSSSAADNVRMDPSTSALLSEENAVSELHGGNHFTYAQVDADFDIADAVELLIVTPNTTRWAHMVFLVTAALNTTVELYEDATHTVLAAQTARNNNRNSATVNTTTINTHNDDGADGTLIWSEVFGISTGGGPGAIVGGGTSRGDAEWILKQNAKYLLKVTSGTDNSSMTLECVWYEHTDIN